MKLFRLRAKIGNFYFSVFEQGKNLKEVTPRIKSKLCRYRGTTWDQVEEFKITEISGETIENARVYANHTGPEE